MTQRTNLENIEAYTGLLPEGFVEETLKRKERIETNRRNANKTCRLIAENVEALSKLTDDMKEAFSKLSETFAHATQISNNWEANKSINSK